MGQPWICPKCGRVWASWVFNCAPCNARAARQARGPFMPQTAIDAWRGGYLKNAEQA
jgi:hypothetical protein